MTHPPHPATVGVMLPPGSPLWLIDQKIDEETLHKHLTQYGLISGDPSTDTISTIRTHPRTLLLLAPEQPEPNQLDLTHLGLYPVKKNPDKKPPIFAHLLAIEQPPANIYHQLYENSHIWGTWPYTDPIRGITDITRLGGTSTDKIILELAKQLKKTLP